jgi:hypothetical protein
MRRTAKKGLLTSLAAVAALSAPVGLHAQACPLCYQSASAASSQFIQALKSGIFILILPSFFISAAVTVIAYRRRND